MGHSPSVLFSVCSVQSTGCNQESVMFMLCSESILWMSSAPAQFFNFNIPSTTGHLRTKYKVKLLFFKCTYLSMHNDAPFGTHLFSVGTYRGNLLVSSRFSTGDLNFWVHSIPLREPCVEKPVMLRASMHIGLLEEHCSNYIMPMLNLQIHQWASSRQHLRVNLAFGHAWMNDYICMYICLIV